MVSSTPKPLCPMTVLQQSGQQIWIFAAYICTMNVVLCSIIFCPFNAKNGHFITPLGIHGMKKAAIFKRLRRSGAVFPAVRRIRRLRHKGPGKDVLHGAKGQPLHHPVNLDTFHVMLGLAMFADGLLNLSNGTHNSFLSW